MLCCYFQLIGNKKWKRRFVDVDPHHAVNTPLNTLLLNTLHPSIPPNTVRANIGHLQVVNTSLQRNVSDTTVEAMITAAPRKRNPGIDEIDRHLEVSRKQYD